MASSLSRKISDKTRAVFAPSSSSLGLDFGFEESTVEQIIDGAIWYAKNEASSHYKNPKGVQALQDTFSNELSDFILKKGNSFIVGESKKGGSYMGARFLYQLDTKKSRSLTNKIFFAKSLAENTESLAEVHYYFGKTIHIDLENELFSLAQKNGVLAKFYYDVH